MLAAGPDRTTRDCGPFLLDIPSVWTGVAGEDGVRAWADPDLEEHVIVGGYHLPAVADDTARRELVDELVDLELGELARLGKGRVVVRRSQRLGPKAVVEIVTGIDGANAMVFAYYFVVTTSTVVKLKYQRVGLERSEREVLEKAAQIVVSMKIREIHDA